MPNSFSTWALTWIGTPTVIAAWAGLFLSLRREWHDRPKLRFLFDATPDLISESDGQEYRTSAIEITITNTGSNAISLDRIDYVVRLADSPGEAKSRSKKLKQAKLVRGEPFHDWIEFRKLPAAFDSINVVDTTGKEWKANGREMKRLRSACLDCRKRYSNA
jgi:hypothetical protein